jgi:hypothetical protein
MVKYLDDLNQKDFKLYKDLADTIYQYYPKGIQAVQEEYGKSEGIVKIYEIVSENIGLPKNKLGKHGVLWQSLLKVLKSKTSKPINGTTYGFVPGFSADLLLEKYEDSSLIRVKRIAFAVSMLGTFYSICGIDETIIKADGRYYQAVNVVTVSPFMEFEQCFNLVKQSIIEIYPEYVFIPFNICMLRVKDTYSVDSIYDQGTVYSFLFNHLFHYYTHHYSRGDNWFGHTKNPNIKLTLTAPPKNQS